MLTITVTLYDNGRVSAKLGRNVECNRSARDLLAAGALEEAKRVILANRELNPAIEEEDE